MGIFDFFNKNKRKDQQNEQCLLDEEGTGEADYGRRLMWQSHNVMKKREKKSF